MILPILHYPDKRLRTQAKRVETVDNSIQTLVKNMFETMYAAPGIGLATTQVDVHLRVIVLDASEDASTPLCLINPEIIQKSGELKWKEGCLSVPEYYENIMRANCVTVRALDENGKTFELEANDLLGVCIQHEIDHLNGVLFVDYLSKLKQKRLLDKFKKDQK
jgi:peptide deformylase